MSDARCPFCRSSGIGHLAVPNQWGHTMTCLNCLRGWKQGGRTRKRARNLRRRILRRAMAG